MLTNNYHLYCRGRRSNKSIAGIRKAYDGSKFTYYPTNTYGIANLGDFGVRLNKVQCRAISSATDSNGGVYFGSGSTPANVNDYKLDSPITSGLTIASGGVISWEDEHCDYLQNVFAVQNTTESEINIWEIGYFGEVAFSSSDNTGYTTLMERTVLPEPVTIAPMETKVIIYKVAFNRIFNVE